MAMPLLRFKQDDGSEYSNWENNVLEKFCVVNPKSDTIGNIFYYIDLGAVDYGRLLSEKIIQKENAPSRAKRLLEKDDVLFQTVRPYQMGHFHYTKTKEEQVVASTGFAQLRMKNGYNGFLYQLLYTKSFNDEVTKRCNEGQYPAINAESLKKVPITIPSSIEEQQKIADLLFDVDNQIEHYHQSLDNLESQKRELLRQVFSQELRFKQDDGSDYPDWEEDVLGKYCDITTGKLNANAMNENGKYDFYTSGIKKYKIDNYAFEGPAITIAGNGATVGYLHIADGKFNAYQRTYVLTNFKCIRRYLYYIIGQELPKKIRKEVRPGVIPYIVLDMLTNLKIFLPCPEEQQKIADFFFDIENRIELERQRMQTMQELKKGLLQQMFC